MRFVRRAIIIMVAAVLGSYVLICVALFAFQRSLIYYPQPRSNREASTLMTLSVGSSTVQASMYPRTGPAALIYFGGNAEDVSLDIPDLVDAFPGRSIFGLHYPGYGGSSGSPSQQAIFGTVRRARRRRRPCRLRGRGRGCAHGPAYGAVHAEPRPDRADELQSGHRRRRQGPSGPRGRRARRHHGRGRRRLRHPVPAAQHLARPRRLEPRARSATRRSTA
jgi:hypothetical protein